MATIKLVEARNGFNAANGQRIRTCEKYWQVFEDTGKPRRGERYYEGDLDCAQANNEDAVVVRKGDPEPEPTPPGLVRVKGDNRLFARTRYGLRAGYEHTGHRCEDAPCCGCCD